MPGTGLESWTVLDGDGVPVGPVERYLAYLTDVERSPHAIFVTHPTCAGVTTYKAVELSGARAASLVACSASAASATWPPQYAKIFGASVVAVDMVADKLT